MIRRVLLAAVLVLLVLGAGTSPATAAFTPPPIPSPSGGPSSGPTYVITPGVGGSELPPPSDQKAVDDATKADRRASHHTPPDDVPGAKIVTTPGADDNAVAGPQTPLAVTMDHVDRVGILWKGFAAAVLMLVLIEITVVRRYLLRRRVTAG